MALLPAIVTAAALWPVLSNGFVNWDDPDALIHNRALDAPHVVTWAFGTTHMSHYQPLSWLTWAVARRWAGAGAAVHHGVSLFVHALNATLTYVLARRLGRVIGLGALAARAAALVAALLFSLHPLRVEPLAWASSFPYVLALAPMLACLIVYVGYASGPSWPWLVAALGCYTLSLLARPAAPGLSLVLLGIDVLAGRLRSSRPSVGVLAEKLPFVIVAAAATLAEAAARSFATLAQVGPGARLSDAALAPALYIARTLVPVRLSPLNVLSLFPRTSWPALVVGLLFIVVVTTAAWKVRRSRPELLLLWLAFLVLLGPAVGLAPSGLQATADRYAYLPGVAVGLAAGAFVARAWPQTALRSALLFTALVAVASLGIAARRQVGWWRDSVTLWTRATALDPHNDVAVYNLAAALAERGDVDAAAARYEELLRMVPDHAPARRNLRLLEAARLEREAGNRAEVGRLAEAVSLYTAALELDSARAHSRKSRGIALVQLGRFREALPDLSASPGDEPPDPELASARAFALIQTGMEGEARRILEEALRASPRHVGLAHNLARLLATAQDRAVRDGARAVELATAVAHGTGGRDARALATLAAAYAEAGRLAEARRTVAQAAALARAGGESELAEEIESGAGGYLIRPRAAGPAALVNPGDRQEER